MNAELTRRSFIGVSIPAAAAMLLKPSIALSSSSSLILANENLAQLWTRTVNSLVGLVVEDGVASREMMRLIALGRIYGAPSARSFHEYYGPKFLIEVRLSPVNTSYDRWFEFDLWPIFDSQNPCRPIKDLNMAEILRITYKPEVDLYGAVVSPCSERRHQRESGALSIPSSAERYNAMARRRKGYSGYTRGTSRTGVRAIWDSEWPHRMSPTQVGCRAKTCCFRLRISSREDQNDA
jgi:hypothetical protein